MFQRILDWIDDNTPVLCAVCGRIVHKKDTTMERMTHGIMVTLCKKCDDEVYHPFTGKEKR